MRRAHPFFLIQAALMFGVFVAVAGAAFAGEAAKRVASLGGGVTEIVYALGQEGRLVARDTTSNHPNAALDLPDVGYIRALSAEGILSVSPDLVIASEGAGPVEAVELLKVASMPIVWVPEGFTEAAVLKKIEIVAAALGVPERGAKLAEDVKAEMAQAAAQDSAPKRVLFILSMTGGRIMAAGANTSADGIIRLAGAENALSSIEGFKPVTDEAILTSNADVILAMASVGERGTSDAQIFAHPAIAATPAGQAKAIVRMDGMLLTGFSVRTGQAMAALKAALSGVGS